MTRRIFHAAIAAQMGVVWATVIEWPYLFIPAAFGLVMLTAAIPEETR